MQDKRTQKQLLEELAALHQQNDDLQKSMTLFVPEEDVFEVIGKSMQAGIYIIQEDRTIFTNSYISLYSGYSREELLTLSFMQDTVHPEDRVRVRKYGIKMIKGEDLTPYEYRILCKDGSIKWLIERVTSINYRGRRAILGNTMDVTDKKRTEDELRSMKANLEILVRERTSELSATNEALKESREQYRTLIEASPDPIIIYDLKGKILTANMQAAGTYGVASVDELLREVKTVFDFLTDEGKSVAMANFSKTLAEGFIQKSEYLVRLRDGSMITTEIHSSIVRSVAGEPRAFISLIRDVTERKRMEEALKQSEEKFSTIFRLSPMNISLSTLADGRYVEANDLWFKTAEYTREEVIGHTSTELKIWANPEDRSRMAKTLMEGGTIRDQEYLFRSKSGKLYSLLFTAEVIEVSGVPHIVSLALDITARKRIEEERKQADKALLESQAKYGTVIETTNTGFLIIDKNGIVLDANPEYVRLTGHARLSDIIGRSVIEWTADYEQEKNAAAVGACIHHGHIRGLEIDYVDAKGNITPIEINATCMEKDGTIQVMTLCRDISERRRAEAALRESEELSAKLIAAMPDLLVRTDIHGEIQFVNDIVLQVSGYGKSELIGKNILFFVAPEDHEKAIQNTLLMMEQRLGPKEYRLVMKNGEKRLFEVNGDILRMEDGVPYNVVIVLRDITNRLRMEQERQELRERLNRAEKMEALGTLAGGVAHDLNNVLGILVGYSELLLEKLPESGSMRQYAGHILQSGMRGAAIIQDLLTLARRGVNVSEVIDLNKVVFGYLKTPEFENLRSYHPQVKIRTDLEEGLLNIKGSPVHLDKTIMNLVANAAEAISGGGEVTIRTENRYLDQPIRGYDEMAEGDYAVLTVSDTGRGISANDLGKIFEPFYTKKVMGRSGTGLGLAVVWGTVKDHRGYIDVQSEEGNGSTFTLYFPVTREEMERAEKAISPVAYMGKGESILVVDDVKEQRELATSMLVRLGYRVESVASGEAAIEYLKNKKADLVVLDMIMEPGMDGMETYRRILEITPGQKAVIVSGFSKTDRVEEAQEMGAGAFVRKPYILEKIGLEVRKELDRK